MTQYQVTAVWWPEGWEPRSPLDVPNCPCPGPRAECNQPCDGLQAGLGRSPRIESSEHGPPWCNLVRGDRGGGEDGSGRWCSWSTPRTGTCRGQRAGAIVRTVRLVSSLARPRGIDRLAQARPFVPLAGPATLPDVWFQADVVELADTSSSPWIESSPPIVSLRLSLPELDTFTISPLLTIRTRLQRLQDLLVPGLFEEPSVGKRHALRNKKQHERQVSRRSCPGDSLRVCLQGSIGADGVTLSTARRPKSGRGRQWRSRPRTSHRGACSRSSHPGR